MKFARYLHDTQAPEWTKAYIDYRGLKKRITAIRRAQEGITHSSSGSDSDNNNSNDSDATATATSRPEFIHALSNQATLTGDLDPRETVLSWSVSRDVKDGLGKDSANPHSLPSLQASTSGQSQSKPLTEPQVHRNSVSLSTRILPSNISLRHIRTISTTRNAHPHIPPTPSPAFTAALAAFFTFLDSQLSKIESFYLDREKEMMARTAVLEGQLRELAEHGEVFNAVHASNLPLWPWPWSTAVPIDPKTKTRSVKKQKVKLRKGIDAQGSGGLEDAMEDGMADTIGRNAGERTASERQAEASGSGTSQERGGVSGLRQLESRKKTLDPDDYLQAKKKLKKAVLEHYRSLEVLNNYRILNLTGFRKALKKFEKVTKIPAQDAYMKDKVDTSAFANGSTVEGMTKRMEELYALRFEHGNKKKAMTHLRAGALQKSHHFSTFRSGMCLGLAVPALISGIYQSFQPHTRSAIPGWDALLFIYGILLIPVLFALLVGVNLVVWARTRINYVFIFELDIRTRLDHREYFETPSLLLSTLCYAFWLSFSRIGSPSVSPTIWPLVWLGFTAVVMFDPLPILFKPSRYWLARNVGKLLISGTKRVEFTDFWMGDQFCSLIFSLSNLYVFVCVYVEGFDSPWLQRCSSSSPYWPVGFVLAALPLFVRLVQSVKRYVDSGLVTHLINGGKYGSGIISYLCYYIWRHQGNNHDASFAAWCLFNTVYSVYASSWDFLMDWSVLRPHAKYPLLRPELIYIDYIPLYYFAIVSNVLVRFIWVIYIPQNGSDALRRTFIAGMLEMLRRCQWNFYRLENEQLGNQDQYRIAHEVPVPYMHMAESAVDDREEVPQSWLSRQRSSLRSRRSKVSEPDEDSPI